MVTQEQANAMAAAARREEAAKAMPDSELEELKAKAAKADELERANMTETERLQKELATEQQSKARLEGTIADVMISADVKTKAVMAGIIDPEAALALIDRGKVRYTPEEGVTGTDEALTNLVAAKPYLKGTPASNPAPNMNRGPGDPANTPVPLTEAQRATAQRMGIPEDKYAESLAGNRTQ